MLDNWDLVVGDDLYFIIGLKKQSVITLRGYLPVFECPEF